MNRIPNLLTSRNAKDILAEIARLSECYQKSQGRALPTNLLFLSSEGAPRHEVYSLTLMWNDGQEKQAEWVRANVMEGVVAA